MEEFLLEVRMDYKEQLKKQLQFRQNSCDGYELGG
jgi:hypothetical protein